jgi:hypothetical protein
MKTITAVSTQVLYRASALYPKTTCLHQAFTKFHTISSAMGLTGPRLVLTCVKRQWKWTYTPLPPSHMNSQWAYRYLAAAAGGS